MIYEKRLKEKLKYIFILELKDRFPILDFDVDFDYYNKNGEDYIDIYTIFIRLNCMKLGVEFINDLSYNLNHVTDIVTRIITEYPIDENGEFNKHVDVYTSEPLIWDLDYKWDDKFNVSFRIMVKYDDK